VTEPQGQYEGVISRRWAQEAALWAALLIALSPTLHDLVGHWQVHSWSRYSLGFLPLLILAIRADSPGRPMRGPALALLVLCLVGQFAASFASVRYVARPIAGAALAGFLVYRNQARPRTALLAIFLVPAPSMLITRVLGGAELAAGTAEVAARVVNVLGASAAAVGPALTLGGLKLEVAPYWSGLVLALQGLGLAWYYSVRRDLGARSTALALAAALLLAFPVQLGMLVSSALALSAGHPSLAAALLDPGSWLVPLFAVILVGEFAAVPAQVAAINRR
jgi:hypothetical protein